MILALLPILKTLKRHNPSLNVFEHAMRTVALVSQQTTKDEVIVAALLHRAKDLLSKEKWERCKVLLCTHHNKARQGLKFSLSVLRLLDQINFTSTTINRKEALLQTFQNCGADAELIVLISIFVEIDMKRSHTVYSEYLKTIDQAIALGYLDGQDELIIRIQNCIADSTLWKVPF